MGTLGVLAADYPGYEMFAELTRREEERGLLKDASRIGNREGWEERLREAGVWIEGHGLVERRETRVEGREPGGGQWSVVRGQWASNRRAIAEKKMGKGRSGFVEDRCAPAVLRRYNRIQQLDAPAATRGGLICKA